MRKINWMNVGARWGCTLGLAAAALLGGCGGGGGGAASVAPAAGGSAGSGGGSTGAEPRSALMVVAGTPGGVGLLDGRGAAARLGTPNGLGFGISGLGVATDGTVYISSASLIRRISPAGDVSTWATGFKSAEGYNSAGGLAVDGAGNLFVADRGNHRIARVSATGVVSTYAGTGVEGSTDGPAGIAQFSFPISVAVDGGGNVYVADQGNQTIRKISPSGVVSTLAGQVGWSNRGHQDGPGAQARFSRPGQLAIDDAGNLLVVEEDNDDVRTVDAAGNVGTLVRVTQPQGVAVRNSSVYISTDHTILKITAGVSTLVAGQVSGTFDGVRGPEVPYDGTAGEARFYFPRSLGLDGAGNLFVDDAYTVRKVSQDAVVSTLAGSFRVFPGSTGGLAAAARFDKPDSVALDGSGNVYVTDYNNHTVRKIAGGVVGTFAGVTGLSSRTNGPPNSLDFPSGLVSDSVGNLDVVEGWGVSLRRIASNGVLGVLRASGAPKLGGKSMAPIIARGSVARDSTGNFYITDPISAGVYKIDGDGNGFLLAGPVVPSGSALFITVPRGAADGAGTDARFSEPNGIAVDAAGTIYVADSRNHTIRRITPAGVVSTWAGLAGTAGDADGPVASARFNNPMGLAFDLAGNLYVTDQDNGLVRKITPAGVVSTVVGQRGKSGVMPGPLPATLSRPAGIVAGPAGELYITDIAENVVLKITPP